MTRSRVRDGRYCHVRVSFYCVELMKAFLGFLRQSPPTIEQIGELIANTIAASCPGHSRMVYVSLRWGARGKNHIEANLAPTSDRLMAVVSMGFSNISTPYHDKVTQEIGESPFHFDLPIYTQKAESGDIWEVCWQVIHACMINYFARNSQATFNTVTQVALEEVLTLFQSEPLGSHQSNLQRVDAMFAMCKSVNPDMYVTPHGRTSDIWFDSREKLGRDSQRSSGFNLFSDN